MSLSSSISKVNCILPLKLFLIRPNQLEYSSLLGKCINPLQRTSFVNSVSFIHLFQFTELFPGCELCSSLTENCSIFIVCSVNVLYSSFYANCMNPLLKCIHPFQWTVFIHCNILYTFSPFGELHPYMSVNSNHRLQWTAFIACSELHSSLAVNCIHLLHWTVLILCSEIYSSFGEMSSISKTTSISLILLWTVYNPQGIAFIHM